MSGFTLCANFHIFPDNYPLGPTFTLAAFSFTQFGGMNMFVNATANEKGLQFPNEGIEVALPLVTDSITLRLGAFAGPIEIEAANANGNIVQQRTIQYLNQFIDLRLFAPEIATVIFKGGDNEGILPRMCVTICQ